MNFKVHEFIDELFPRNHNLSPHKSSWCRYKINSFFRVGFSIETVRMETTKNATGSWFGTSNEEQPSDAYTRLSISQFNSTIRKYTWATEYDPFGTIERI